MDSIRREEFNNDVFFSSKTSIKERSSLVFIFFIESILIFLNNFMVALRFFLMKIT